MTRPRAFRLAARPVLAATLLIPGLVGVSGSTLSVRPAQAATYRSAGYGSGYTSAYSCGTPSAPSVASGQQAFAAAYANWTSRYVTASGAGGGLRVVRPENGNDTVSEGIGYGMIAAAYAKDRATFNGLWRYEQQHLDANGLMNWRIGPDGSVWGQNAATDADEDMAFALIVADRTWGGYRSAATSMISRILADEVEPGTNVLKPGDVWGGSSVTNPSYFAPAFYKEFAAYTGNTRWTAVTNSTYQMIAAVDAKTAAGQTGLLPDWMTASGTPVPGMNFTYSYNATRTPWRLGIDAAWTCDARALAQLGKLNAFWTRVGPANIRDGYTLAGQLTGQWHNAAFVAPAAAGAVLSSNAGLRQAFWQQTVALPADNYYDSALRMLGLLFMSGQMRPPVSLSAGQPPPPPPPPPPPGPTSCSISYHVRNAWPGGFVVDITITDTGAPITSWTLGWRFTGGQQIVNAWNMQAHQSGGAVSATSMSYNGRLATGQSTGTGFQASGPAQVPAQFTVNGRVCTTG